MDEAGELHRPLADFQLHVAVDQAFQEPAVLLSILRHLASNGLERVVETVPIQ